MTLPLPDTLGIAVAALCGAAVGIERQWSGHATGATARLGGVRTFTLLGGFAGIAGWLWTRGVTPGAEVLLAGACALVVAGYVAASRADVEGTTEVAGLVVLAAGWLAGLEYLALASAITATACLLLVEKRALHSLVGRLDDAEIRAGVRFAVMAAVVLPLLPPGPYGPFGGIRPQALWALVLFFSGLSFAGYAARRLVGPQQGYPIAGLIGGVVSSTNVTLTFARVSRADPAFGLPLALGVVGACGVLFPRVLLTAWVLSPSLAWALLPLLVPPFVVAVVTLVLTWRINSGEPTGAPPGGNPLEVRPALQMVVLFQSVLMLVWVMQHVYGEAGLLASGAIAGLTDLDAVTLSMAQRVDVGAAADSAAHAVVAALASNTVLKVVMATVVGRGRFRWITATALLLQAAAALGALVLL